MAAVPPYTSFRTELKTLIPSVLGIDLWYTDPIEMTKLPRGSGDHNKVKSTDIVEIAMTWLVPRNLCPLLILSHKTLKEITPFPYIEGLRKVKDSFALAL